MAQSTQRHLLSGILIALSIFLFAPRPGDCQESAPLPPAVEEPIESSLPGKEGENVPPPPEEGPAAPVPEKGGGAVPAEEEVLLPVGEGTIRPAPEEEAPLLPAEGTAVPSPAVEEPPQAPILVPPAPFWQRFTPASLKSLIPEGLEFNGYLKNETAYRYQNPVAFSKVLNIFQLEATYPFSPNLRFYSRFWSFYDLAYDFQDLGTVAPMKPLEFIQPPNPGEPEPDIENIREIDIDQSGVVLKEIYFDIFMPSLDLRVGKQIVRWGIVEGWRILDEVNPLDFTEHILRDVTDRYIPLWMVKADYYLGPVTFEGLMIPDLRGHKPASLKSEWSQFQVLPDLQRVPRTPENYEWGLRVSGTAGGVELVGTSFYHWDDFATAFRSVSGLGLGSLGIAPEVTFTPVYRRLHTMGFGFSKSFGKIVLEGEGAYTRGKYWGTVFSLAGENVFGETQRDYVKYVLGFKTVIRGADISLNFSQDIIPDHIPIIQQDRTESTASLFARKELRYGSLVPQLLVISLMNRDEWLYRPKLEYKYSDKITFLFGVDIFRGAPAERDPETGNLDPGRLNFFGYFDKDDRAYMEAKYSF